MVKDIIAESVGSLFKPVVLGTNLDQYLAPYFYNIRPIEPELRKKLSSIEFPTIDNSKTDEVALFPDLYPRSYRTVFKGLLAHSLYDEGIGSVFLYDNKQFPTCKLGADRKACAKCTNKSTKLSEIMGLDSEYINKKEGIIDIPNKIENRLESDAEASVKGRLRISSLNKNDKRQQKLLNEYMNAGKITWHAVAELDQQYDFDYFITSITPGLPKRAALEYADHKNKAVVGIKDPTFGRGDGYIFNWGERPLTIYMNDAIWKKVEDKTLNQSEKQKLNKFMKVRFATTKYQQYSQSGEDIKKHLKTIPDESIIYTAPTHLLWDAAIDTRVSRVFDSHNEWLYEIIDSFLNRSDVLIIKTHPAEAARGTNEQVMDLINRNFEQLPDNINILPPDTKINTYDLIEFSDIVLSYTSTVGLESSYLGTPVITAGNAHYTNKGFTHDPTTKQEYFRYLSKNLGKLNMDGEMRQLANRYAYNFFIERPKYVGFIKPTWLVDEDEYFFTLSSYDELISDDTMSKISTSIKNEDMYFYYDKTKI